MTTLTDCAACGAVDVSPFHIGCYVTARGEQHWHVICEACSDRIESGHHAEIAAAVELRFLNPEGHT